MSVMEKRVTLPARLRHHDEIQETCFTPVVPTPCQMYQKSRAQLPLKQQQQQTTEKKLQQQQQVQQSPTFTKNHHLLLDLDIKTTNLKSHVL